MNNEDKKSFKDIVKDASRLNLSDFLFENLDKDFTGNIQVNFFKGGITNITKTESFKP